MDTRVITMTSQTAAIKAQRMLQKNGIPSQVVRADPRQTPRGCAWGLRLGVFTVDEAVRLMRHSGIAVGEIIHM